MKRFWKPFFVVSPSESPRKLYCKILYSDPSQRLPRLFKSGSGELLNKTKLSAEIFKSRSWAWSWKNELDLSHSKKPRQDLKACFRHDASVPCSFFGGYLLGSLLKREEVISLQMSFLLDAWLTLSSCLIQQDDIVKNWRTSMQTSQEFQWKTQWYVFLFEIVLNCFSEIISIRFPASVFLPMRMNISVLTLSSDCTKDQNDVLHEQGFQKFVFFARFIWSKHFQRGIFWFFWLQSNRKSCVFFFAFFFKPLLLLFFFKSEFEPSQLGENCSEPGFQSFSRIPGIVRCIFKKSDTRTFWRWFIKSGYFLFQFNNSKRLSQKGRRFKLRNYFEKKPLTNDEGSWREENWPYFWVPIFLKIRYENLLVSSRKSKRKNKFTSFSIKNDLIFYRNS